MESIPVELPIEPNETRWDRKKNKISSRFEFRNREDVKDFVSAIQELEDRTQHFVNIKIERYAVTVEEEIEAVRPLETTNKFFIKIKEIYGEMNSE
jgi:pterin-4a-carbinolamine dehydratase